MTADGLLRGLEFDSLPEGWTPIAATLLVKCLDEEGNPGWAFRTSADMNDEELLGVITVRSDILRRKLLGEYLGDDEDDA